jgi:Uma2 family endonuclease
MAYEEAAQEYLRSLPLEHFMEATPQATQRKITLESLDLVSARRADVHVFNELLVQYPRPRQRRPVQVVPDNIVVVSDKPIEADTSFNLPLEPAGPFWVLEYVSKHNKRKDYEKSFEQYERELKVPDYLVFYPEAEDLTLYRHNGKKYVTVKPNKHGRYPVPPLEIEMKILDGWVRFWHQGRLLPLPAELQREFDAANRRANEAERRATEADNRAADLQRRATEADNRAADLERRLEQAEQELARLRASKQPPPNRKNNGPKSAQGTESGT